MHYYKLLPGDHSALWENRESLDKYIKRLKELWDEDPEWQEKCKGEDEKKGLDNVIKKPL